MDGVIMNENINKGKYDDIINLSRPISKKYKPMSLYDRAAQFAPFAALTGHEDEIKETARLTDNKIELDEDEKIILNEKIKYIMMNMDKDIQVKITYFVPDEKKTGGEYRTKSGIVKKVDEYGRRIIMNDRQIIEMDCVIEIEIDNE